MNEEICSYFVCIEYPNTCMDCEGKGKSANVDVIYATTNLNNFVKDLGKNFQILRTLSLKTAIISSIIEQKGKHG